MMIGGPLDLGGNVRTVSTLRTLNSPALVLGAGANISWGLGTVATIPSSVSNGTLRVVRHPNAAGTYVAFRLRDTAFRQNAGLILGSNVVLILGNNWNPGVSNLATLTLDPGAIVALNESASLRNVSLSSLEGDGTVGNFITNSSATATLTLNGGALTGTATFAGRLINTDTNFNPASTNGTLALVKSGSHTQILTGDNSYSGPTTVLGGTLLVMGDQSAATGLVTVASNAVFGGTGTVGASVTVSNGGTLYVPEFPGTFTALGQVTLNGTTLLGVARDGFDLTNNLCRASGTITYGGTLLLTNLGTSPMQVGDSFKIFDAPAYAGAFTNIVAPAGYTFTSTLTTDGRVTVATGLPNTAPVLNELSDQDLHIGATLNVTATATDNEAPPQVITYSLVTPPEGMTIDTNSGALTWRAPYASAGSAGVVTVVATDSGIPTLSATQTFLIDVLPITTPPAVADPTWTNGAFGLTLIGDAGPDYIIQASSDLLAWTNIHVATPPTLPVQWTDSDATNFNARFYRLLVQP
jgi:autotransporter-associated beta strand protein